MQPAFSVLMSVYAKARPAWVRAALAYPYSPYIRTFSTFNKREYAKN